MTKHHDAGHRPFYKSGTFWCAIGALCAAWPIGLQYLTLPSQQAAQAAQITTLIAKSDAHTARIEILQATSNATLVNSQEAIRLVTNLTAEVKKLEASLPRRPIVPLPNGAGDPVTPGQPVAASSVTGE